MNNVGKLLKSKREDHGLSLAYVSGVLKIREKYLEAIENWDFNELPQKVYIIGYIRTYSSFLGFDGEKIIKKFKEIYGTDSSVILPEVVYEDSNPNNIIIFISIALSLAVYSMWSSMNFKDKKLEDKNVLISNNQHVQPIFEYNFILERKNNDRIDLLKIR